MILGNLSQGLVHIKGSFVYSGIHRSVSIGPFEIVWLHIWKVEWHDMLRDL